MAKKYLLYIHDDRFEQEPQKSALVNLLLDRHYDYYKPGTLIEDFRDDEDLDGSVVGSVELAEKLKDMQEEKPMDFCKEGHPIPEGRTKCMGKGCKYS